jgi:hypothetical protein
MMRVGPLGWAAIPLVLVVGLLLADGQAPPPAAAATSPCRAGSRITLADLLYTTADYAGPLTGTFGDAMAPMLMSDLALECYGDRTLRFTAWVRDPGVVGWEHLFGLKPDWFRSAKGLFVSVAAEPPPGVTALVALAVPPALGDLQAKHVGHWVTVTGHFDDPAARTCVAIGEPALAPTAAEAVGICRSTFVVASVARTTAPATSTEERVASAPGIEPGRVGGWLMVSAALAGTLACWLAARRRRA